VDVYDPRDGVWETDAAADLSAGSFAGKLSWQMGNATDADVVAFWLPPGARAETAMLQLGALAAKRGGARRGSSVIVGLPDGHAADVVRRFAAASAVQHVPALADVVRVARYELTRTDG